MGLDLSEGSTGEGSAPQPHRMVASRGQLSLAEAIFGSLPCGLLHRAVTTWKLALPEHAREKRERVIEREAEVKVF